MSDEERIKRVEEAIVIMKDLLVHQSGRLDGYFNALEREREERKESRKYFEFKLNALIDAQIKNEDDIAKLKDSATELRKSTEVLLKVSKSTIERVKKLEKNK
ncbi:MAG TPA: hypothetical protein VK892_02910 [Pyrinomonadaceae bacterium]|nr:hypothetical protein [Pyrinomonadaceae bacterium]